MKKYLTIITTAILLASCTDKPQPSKQGDGAEERFVDSVVARMDLKQQIGQLEIGRAHV